MRVYTIDDSFSNTATPARSLQHGLVEPARTGFEPAGNARFLADLAEHSSRRLTRARDISSLASPLRARRPPAFPGFLSGLPVGAVVVGGSQASNPQAQLGLAGSNNGSNLHVARNLFTITDDVAFTKGRHQFRVGVWMQPFQSNEEFALSQYGQLTFTGLPNLPRWHGELSVRSRRPPQMSWRSFFGAFYAEDVIRVRPTLTVSLGFRDESSTGWNEAHDQAANYTLRPQCVSSARPSPPATSACRRLAVPCSPTIARHSCREPRIGLAWSPFDRKTVIRAGFGMYNDMQDALGYRADQNAPFNPTYTIAATSLASIFAILALPISRTAPPPTTPLALLVPGRSSTRSVHANCHLVFAHGPAGTFAQHVRSAWATSEITAITKSSAWMPTRRCPVVCPASPCPATFPTTVNPGTDRRCRRAWPGTPVPAGTLLQSHQHQAEHLTREHLDLVLARASATTTRCKWT